MNPLQSLLRAAFDAHASRPAIEGSALALSYAELALASDELARRLREQGVRPGDTVPLFMARSALLVLTQVALVRLGAAYAPIDLASPEARQRAMLDAVDAALIVIDGAPVPSGSAPVFDIAAWWQRRASSAGANLPGLWLAPPDDSAACVMFTSGSSGAPKGVRVPHGGIARLVVGANYAHFGPQQRWGFLSSPAFDASTLEVWGALLNGGCCVVQEEALPSLDALGEFLLHRRITDAWLTAALFNAMVEDQLPALGQLQQLLIGGERVSAAHARRMLHAHPGVRLINGYGPTENTTFTLCHTIELHDTEAAAGVPIGRPLAGTRVRIEPTSPQPANVGELWASGAGVALGYLGDSELTQQKFVTQSGERWYRTGDLVRERADGVFEFVGRIDRQIKLRGHRIELDEVELALARCPGIGNSAVLLVGARDEQRRIVAVYSALDASAAPSEHAVAAHLRHALPPPAVPTQYALLPHWPATVQGKADREALARALDADMHRPRADAIVAPPSADPMSAFEAALAAIWQELLPHASVDRRAHFLRIGGTSLLALRVAALVRKRLHRHLSPVDVLRHPVLFDQARVAAQADALLHRSHDGDDAEFPGWTVALTRTQQNVLASSRLDASGCAYLVHVALHLPTAPDWPAWRRAFEQLAQRHPALRLLAFHDGHAGRARLADDLAPGWWQQYDDALAQAPRDLDWPGELLARVNRPLDTRERGSMRVDAWLVLEGGALIVWTLHHHVIDEAAIGVALAELDALLQGRVLPPVYGSAFAFTAIEAAWSDPRALAASARHLAAALHGQRPPLNAAPELGSERTFALDRALQQQLRTRCRTLGLTPFPLLLAAYGLALQEVFGPAFRFVSTPFSRRAEPELLEPIGYLLDVRLIEAGALPGEAPGQTLARVALAVRQAQTPSFQLLDDLIQAVTERDPDASRCLAQFGLTWRIDPARRVDIAGQAVQLLRVPQAGARYPMGLHVAQLGDSIGCSIEAVESAHRSGQVQAVWDAFVRCLGLICAAPESACAGAPASPGGTAASHPHAPALRAVWARWLGVVASTIEPASHFVRSGGSSLTAMRMAAGLRRDHGLRLDVSAFLAEPSFAQLCALSREEMPSRPEGYVLVGPADFTRVMLLVPGSGGQAAGLYALADELQRGLPPRSAVAIVDLDAALHAAPQDEPLWFVSRRIVQIVRDLGQPRVVGIVGFSLGGSLALKVAQGLAEGPMPAIWMLDTFAPRVMHHGLLRKVERRLAWALYGGKPEPRESARSAAPLADEHPLPLRSAPHRWQRLAAQIGASRFAAAQTRVRLIQARRTVGHVGLVWQRRNNGFVPRHYAAWDVHTIDGDHLDLPRHLAASTARIIVEYVQIDADELA